MGDESDLEELKPLEDDSPLNRIRQEALLMDCKHQRGSIDDKYNYRTLVAKEEDPGKIAKKGKTTLKGETVVWKKDKLEKLVARGINKSATFQRSERELQRASRTSKETAPCSYDEVTQVHANTSPNRRCSEKPPLKSQRQLQPNHHWLEQEEIAPHLPAQRSLETERNGAPGGACVEEVPAPQGQGVVRRPQEECHQRKRSGYWAEMGFEQEAPDYSRHSPALPLPSPQKRLLKEQKYLKAHTQQNGVRDSGSGDENSQQTCRKEVADDVAHRYQEYQQDVEQSKGEDEARGNQDARGSLQPPSKMGSQPPNTKGMPPAGIFFIHLSIGLSTMRGNRVRIFHIHVTCKTQAPKGETQSYGDAGQERQINTDTTKQNSRAHKRGRTSTNRRTSCQGKISSIARLYTISRCTSRRGHTKSQQGFPDLRYPPRAGEHGKYAFSRETPKVSEAGTLPESRRSEGQVRIRRSQTTQRCPRVKDIRETIIGEGIYPPQLACVESGKEPDRRSSAETPATVQGDIQAPDEALWMHENANETKRHNAAKTRNDGINEIIQTKKQPVVSAKTSLAQQGANEESKKAGNIGTKIVQKCTCGFQESQDNQSKWWHNREDNLETTEPDLIHEGVTVALEQPSRVWLVEACIANRGLYPLPPDPRHRLSASAEGALGLSKGEVTSQRLPTAHRREPHRPQHSGCEEGVHALTNGKEEEDKQVAEEAKQQMERDIKDLSSPAAVVKFTTTMALGAMSRSLKPSA
ncbi:hypothetical protein Emag_003469 [Eimeria magna]